MEPRDDSLRACGSIPESSKVLTADAGRDYNSVLGPQKGFSVLTWVQDSNVLGDRCALTHVWATITNTRFIHSDTVVARLRQWAKRFSDHP